jgi:hypothetical protein
MVGIYTRSLDTREWVLRDTTALFHVAENVSRSYTKQSDVLILELPDIEQGTRMPARISATMQPRPNPKISP